MTHARNNLVPFRVHAHDGQDFTIHAVNADDAARRFRDCKVVPADMPIIVQREPEEAPEVQVGRNER